MRFQISPNALNVIHLATAAIPGAVATALVSGGGNNALAASLFASAILSAIAQACHFSATTVSVINALPALTAQLTTTTPTQETSK